MRERECAEHMKKTHKCIFDVQKHLKPTLVLVAFCKIIFPIGNHLRIFITRTGLPGFIKMKGIN